ncbi:MAG: SMC-Scp complex subunit ScpB, partial [Gammaproteobacteria bacterium]
MNEDQLKQIIEAVLFAADEPLDLNRLMSLFPEESGPDRDMIKQALTRIQDEYADRSVELKEVGSGYRFQVKQDYAQWASKLWEERPARYSRATLETLALIAYRQPITRGEIEEVRGVSVSSQIIKSLMEREWIKVVGHRDVPGKPALYATSREFLDYFNLKSLEELPSLAELRDIDAINAELDLSLPMAESENPTEAEANDAE